MKPCQIKTDVDRGFTLLEALVAVAILSIAMVTLIRVQTQSMNNVIRVAHHERAVFIVENQLHWTFLDLNEAETWEEYAQADGEDGDYAWEVMIEPAEMESQGEAEITMLRIRARATWPEGSNQGVYELETFYLWGESQ